MLDYLLREYTDGINSTGLIKVDHVLGFIYLLGGGCTGV